ncbi:MAG: ABC transporter permease [Fervidobacterium sp.]
MNLIKFEFKRIFSRPLTYMTLIAIPLIFVLFGILFFKSVSESELKIGVYSKDKSPLSRFTVGVVLSLFKGGTIGYVDENYEEELKNGNLNAVVVIPEDFTSSLFSGKKTKITYVPSPVNTEISAAAFLVFKKMFEDLSGGPFFNPKVLHEMYTAANVPAPELVTEKSLDFSQAFAPNMIFVVTMFLGIIVGTGIITRDREIGLLKQFALSKQSMLKYVLTKLIVVFSLSALSGLISYLFFAFTHFNVDPALIVLLIVFNALFYSSFALLLSSLFLNSSSANIVGAAFAILFLLSSGIFTQVSQLPNLLKELVTSSILFKSTYIIRSVQFLESSKGILVREFFFVAFSVVASIGLIFFTWLRMKFVFSPDKILKDDSVS